MGICQSTALKVIIYDLHGDKTTHYFSMKRMRSFQTIGDVLSLTNVNLTPQDKIYARTHIGLDEIPTYTQFQIQDLVIKNKDRIMKYRVCMEAMY